jgi:penicillin-binding protein 1A
MELYVNKIFLGYRSYGFGAAAQAYFGRNLDELTLSEIAVLAGLPKAPSTMNPIYSVDRATQRRNVVLSRMLSEKYITQAEFDEARAEPIISQYHGAEIELSAPYVAEIARAWMVSRYGEEAYESGMRITTTIDSKLQKAGHVAAIKNLLNYDERHGYRGAEKVLWKAGQTAMTSEEIAKHLRRQPTYGELRPAVVTKVADKSATVYVKSYGEQTISWENMNWARKFRTDDRQGAAPKAPSEIVAVGEQVWVRAADLDITPDVSPEEKEAQTEDDQVSEPMAITWRLSQVPNANTAFVAINPENGAVLSLVGGFNFVHSKFNRATQSVRQVGSSIKPFIYAAALDKDMTLASLVNDAPINKWDKSAGTAWRPKNSPPTYTGPTRLRIGLAQSKNVMAVRVLREVGLDETRDYLTRFGFDKSKLPRSETIALGAGSLTPVQMAQGFSVFANGGYYVEPFYISKVEDPFGKIEFEANPKVVCHQNCPDMQAPEFAKAATEDAAPSIEEATNASEIEPLDIAQFNEEDLTETDEPRYAPKVISEQTAFLTREMLYSNVWGGGNWREGTGWNGTGWRAQKLKRRDVGGKTGTTNDSKDAWYNGYGPGIVATAWVGFDDHQRKLGRTTANANLGKEQITGAEAGAKTAQPAWVDFMGMALEGHEVVAKQVPNDITRVRIDRDSGLLTNKTDGSTMFEYFKIGTEPTEYVQESLTDTLYSSDESGGESLF